ncbi:MAG: polysaccharide biosynthesis/export family protein [Bacteroidales bacterium]|nr:polysaccharide biosynthesis/export family protein [Bacteroidales bacterium]
MKNLQFPLILVLILSSCTSQKKLAYLNNLPEPSAEGFFTMTIPEYKIQNRDVLHITLKAMDADGMITDYLGTSGSGFGSASMQTTGGGYLWGYNVNKDGDIIIPVLGKVHVEGKTLDEVREMLQQEFDKSYNNAVVECKLLSFKFTVIGEVRSPGTYINYSNYLTVLEAIGQAGGVSDYGRRDNLLVVRPVEGGTKTYRLNLQDKAILSHEAYFLLPNDVVIVEPETRKIFNLNFPTFTAVVSAIASVFTTTLLLINYIGK